MIRIRLGRLAMRRTVATLMLASVTLTSCAYYNTFYLARRYHDRATGGLPYLPDKADGATAQNFNRSVDYARKLIGQYPKDKLVDDAYMLWARALLGVDDPRQSIKLLEEFAIQFPDSPLLPDSRFYLGLANRQARKYTAALRSFDEFLSTAPKNHDLRPYALYERARTLMSLERPGEAAASAAEVIDRYPKFKLVDRARLARAEALLAQGAHEDAQQAFRDLGTRADTDADRLKFLLREADALEAAHRYDVELRLLNDALAHEPAPVVQDTTGGRVVQPNTTPGSDAYGRLLLRIGTAELLAGRTEGALDSYRRVARDYPRTQLGAEAQYRIGYAYETVTDDFEKARSEYGRVREHGAGGPFVDQAQLRLSNLDRLAQFRSSTGDSAERKAEAAFLLAEQYLFQLDKPDRALEEYRKIAQEFDGTAMAAKALNAQAWVLSRKLDRRSEADSLFWAVVNQYPKTEAQLAARDYLELAGVSVPENLIQLPEPKYAVVDSVAAPEPTLPPTAFEPAMTPMQGDSILGPSPAGFPPSPPIHTPPFGIPPGPVAGTPPSSPPGPTLAPPPVAGTPPAPPPGPTLAPPPPPVAARRDSTGVQIRKPGPRDSTNVPPPPGVSAPAPSDTTQDRD